MNFAGGEINIDIVERPQSGEILDNTVCSQQRLDGLLGSPGAPISSLHG